MIAAYSEMKALSRVESEREQGSRRDVGNSRSNINVSVVPHNEAGARNLPNQVQGMSLLLSYSTTTLLGGRARIRRCAHINNKYNSNKKRRRRGGIMATTHLLFVCGDYTYRM